MLCSEGKTPACTLFFSLETETQIKRQVISREQLRRFLKRAKMDRCQSLLMTGRMSQAVAFV